MFAYPNVNFLHIQMLIFTYKELFTILKQISVLNLPTLNFHTSVSIICLKIEKVCRHQILSSSYLVRFNRVLSYSILILPELLLGLFRDSIYVKFGLTDLDEVESERRRNECMDNMADLESQFEQLKEQ